MNSLNSRLKAIFGSKLFNNTVMHGIGGDRMKLDVKRWKKSIADSMASPDPWDRAALMLAGGTIFATTVSIASWDIGVGTIAAALGPIIIAQTYKGSVKYERETWIVLWAAVTTFAGTFIVSAPLAFLLAWQAMDMNKKSQEFYKSGGFKSTVHSGSTDIVVKNDSNELSI